MEDLNLPAAESGSSRRADQPFDLLLRGGIVVTGDGVRRADVGVRGEIVTDIAPELSGENALEAVRCDWQVRPARRH